MRSIRMTAAKRAAEQAKTAAKSAVPASANSSGNTGKKAGKPAKDLAVTLLDMEWRPLQKMASKNGVLKRGMGRKEIIEALLAKQAAK